MKALKFAIPLVLFATLVGFFAVGLMRDPRTPIGLKGMLAGRALNQLARVAARRQAERRRRQQSGTAFAGFRLFSRS